MNARTACLGISLSMRERARVRVRPSTAFTPALTRTPSPALRATSLQGEVFPIVRYRPSAIRYPLSRRIH